MKLFTAVLILCAMAVAAPAATKKKPAAAPAGQQAQTLTIPKDATPNNDGTYSWTDKDGTKWLYAKTPFGIMRSAASTPATAASTGPVTASAETVRLTNITDKGDSIHFERTTPFGPVTWEKKKTDLSDEERSIVEQKSADQKTVNTQ